MISKKKHGGDIDYHWKTCISERIPFLWVTGRSGQSQHPEKPSSNYAQYNQSSLKAPWSRTSFAIIPPFLSAEGGKPCSFGMNTLMYINLS